MCSCFFYYLLFVLTSCLVNDTNMFFFISVFLADNFMVNGVKNFSCNNKNKDRFFKKGPRFYHEC